MTNEEIIKIIEGKVEYYSSSLSEYYDEELINALVAANKLIEENDKLKAEIEQLKARNEANRHDLKLSVNAQSFIRRLENEVFSAECFNSELDNVEIGNLICLGNVADILEEMCDWKR